MNNFINIKLIITIIGSFFLFVSLVSFSIIVSLNTISHHDIISENDTLKTTKELIKYLKKVGEKNHLTEFTFVQETIRFDENEKSTDTTTWYEAVKYPDKFRIDFGDKTNGDANLNRNDSIFVYRNFKLVHEGPEIQEFMILEGGIFYYSEDEILKRLKLLGINTDVFSISNYKGRLTYIIGAKKDNLSVPQIWLDTEHLYVVRRISKSQRSGNFYDVKYDDYKKVDGFWIETWIEFYRDKKLIQTERYNQIDVKSNLDDRIFDPKLFGKYYWF